MNYTTPTNANIAAGDRDGMDATWLTDIEKSDDVTVEYGLDCTRYEWDDGSVIVEHYGGWDFGIHTSWLNDTNTVYCVQTYDGCRLNERFSWPEAIPGLDERHTQPNQQAVIEDVTQHRDRNLLKHGQARKCKPMADAYEIEQAEGRLFEMMQLARQHADASLAVVSVRTPDGELYIVSPE